MSFNLVLRRETASLFEYMDGFYVDSLDDGVQFFDSTVDGTPIEFGTEDIEVCPGTRI